MIYDLKSPISIQNDPWEAYNDIDQHGSLQLSNIEFTTTTLCNMRCAHCAVGYTLQLRDPDTLPCLLYTSPSPRDGLLSRMPSSA